MKMFIIDTNALLSFVTDRNHEQQEKVSTLFEQAARSKCTIHFHQHVISEFIYVLEKVYHHSKTSINRMIADLISMPGIEIRDDLNYKVVLNDWPAMISDFGDAVVASLWRSIREASIVTFDKKFIKELKQIGAEIYMTNADGE
ncbi:MAG: PIN domain-containing protein [Proteobacteria bacterium]|nr:PIN domain-containing protein [Pseudomonadota bacterium]